MNGMDEGIKVPGGSHALESKKAIRFIPVSTIDDVANTPEGAGFHPTFTHQMFGDEEEISGYTHASVKIFFTRAGLQTYIEYDCEPIDPNSVPEEESVEAIIIDALDHEPHQNLGDFEAAIEADKAFTPPGELLSQYSRQEDGAEVTYQIYKATPDAPGIHELHCRMHTFVMMFIDAASFVDATDERWRFYMLFKTQTSSDGTTSYEFAGFSTLYNFYAYPHHIRPRTSQFLLLPSFQRQGHGDALLTAIYADHEGVDNIRDITVEDPSANFSLLVEAVATRLCWAALNSAPLDADGNVEERALKAIAQKYKVSKDPLTLATETFLLSKLDRSDAAQYKQYRIKVKRRLHGLFKDDLAEIEDKAERLKLLQMSYEQTETNYRNLINKMQTRT